MMLVSISHYLKYTHAIPGFAFTPHPLYYHWTTFLQSFTIDFPLLFPHPSIPSEISGPQRNDSKSMSAFWFGDILPTICCNSLQKVLDWPFCNFVVVHWAAKFKVRPPRSSAETHWNWIINKGTFVCVWSGDWNYCGCYEFCPSPWRSLSSGFALVSLGTCILHIGHLMK